MSTTLKRVLKEVLFGVVEGLAMYYIFVVAIPWVLSTTLRVPIPEKYALSPIYTTFFLGVFIVLGVLSSVVRPPINIVFEASSAVLALTILLSFIELGPLKEFFEYDGTVIEIEFDIQVLILLFVGFTILNCVIRVFERLFTMED